MRIVYSSDLHGQIRLYQQLLDLAVTTEAAVAIVGGDLLPHALQRATALDLQRGFVHNELAPLLANYKQRHPRLTLYVIPGNDDWLWAYRTILELDADGLLVNFHHRAVQIDTHLWLNGSGLIGLTPFAIKDYERRDEIDGPPPRIGQALRSDHGTIEPIDQIELLARPALPEAFAQLVPQSVPQHTIYVFHVPPWQSQLDRRTGGAAAGSRAVRNFIEHHRPPLTLHGHIHESPEVTGTWIDQIGQTIAINPGQGQRGFHAVTLDTDDVRATPEHTVYGRGGIAEIGSR